MLNHEKSETTALTIVKKKLQQIVFKTILRQNKCVFFLCGKTMDSNLQQHDLRDDTYFILK